MRRNVFLFAFGALVAVACANSTTPEPTGTIVKSDASAEETGSGYDAGYGSDDTGAPVEDTGTATDTGKKETSTVADSAVKDTGSTVAGDCDPNDSKYDAEFLVLALSGATPVDCGAGCQSTECCYMPGAVNTCLPQ